MRLIALVATLCGLTIPTYSLELDTSKMVDEINKRILESDDAEQRSTDKGATTMGGPIENKFMTPGFAAGEPQWGVVLKNKQGEPVDVFGQVPYTVHAGMVTVPGYVPPSGTYLEVVPLKELQSSALAVASLQDDPMFAPITKLPKAMEEATNYLIEAVCTLRARPSEIELSLVVSASGSILVAQAGTEAGSSVTWNLFEDLCPRNGYK